MVRCLICQKEVIEAVKSRLSPDSYLRHDKELGYSHYLYCEPCHLGLLSKLWARVMKVSVQDTNPAPTAI
jgi:hypothetical protein